MQRRQFLSLSGLGLAGFMLPNAQLIAAEELLAPADVAKKKLLADTVLALAKQGGTSYCDVRIGRYLNQAIITREDKVQNVTNSESAGVGIRVIVDGAWGFAASNQSSEQGVAAAVTQALVRADLDLAADVGGDLAAQVTLGGEFCDFATQLLDLLVREIFDLCRRIDTGGCTDFLCSGATNTVDVGQRDNSVLVIRNVDACNTGHSVELQLTATHALEAKK